MNLDNLRDSLNNLLVDESLPVQASTNWATRTESLSTGLGGVRLAVLEYDRLTRLSDWRFDAIDITNVFSAEMPFLDSPTLKDSKLYDSPKTEALGDVFLGYASKVWTHLVLHEPIVELPFLDKPNDIVRPGLGHGELARDLVRCAIEEKWLSYLPSLGDVNGVGWCNGKSGLLSVLALCYEKSGNEDLLNHIVELHDEIFVLAAEKLETTEFGLCHGIAGVFACLAGSSRVLRDTVRSDQIKERFLEFQESINLTLLPPNLNIDNSWLTGSAGFLWASCSIFQKPKLNPLFPSDQEPI